MHRCVLILIMVTLCACGGGSGVSNTPVPNAPPEPPQPPAAPNPVTSNFFTDASAALPDSRTKECLYAKSVDLDTDGDLDLVLAIGTSFDLTSNEPVFLNVVLQNDGTGRFTDVSMASLPDNREDSRYVATGDFNTDGFVDVVIANANGITTTHAYYHNTGSGGVLETAPTPLPVANFSFSVEARDFDSDNDLDLFFANSGGNDLLVNDGFGVFSDQSASRLPQNDVEATTDVAIGDVDGDGDLDLLLASVGAIFADGKRNLLWLNDGLGLFSDVTSTQMPDQSDESLNVTLGDVDSDGDLDAVVGNVAGDTAGPIPLDRLLLNDGNGTFTDATIDLWPQTTPANTTSVALLDIDRDGDLDLLLAETLFGTEAGRMRAYANDGTGNFTEQTALLLGEVVGNIRSIEVADFNGDGNNDLYLCASENRGQDLSAGRDFLLFGQ